ncbi:MAG: L-threonylcarbamoyladenylate synthase [Alphaproteobacteria bacterium]|nr:L-threonylcarbamoyladenylate synthase [Alphaproteobacteria bacterium]
MTTPPPFPDSTPILPINGRNLAYAAHLLRAGGLVAFPTETVYGLGCDATNGAAVARLYAAKGRPHFNPLISHVPTVEAAFRIGKPTPLARLLAENFWPGPLTLVLERQPDCPVADLATAGLDSVAVRVPARDDARDFLAAIGRPVAAPSANASGQISPTDAEAVKASLDGRISLILDGGATAVGLESTILDARGETPVLLRPGGVSLEEIASVTGPITRPAKVDQQAPDAPGMLTSHYAPCKPVRLNATEVSEDEALLAFGKPLSGAAAVENLSRDGDLIEAAANLFRLLRLLDRTETARIAVMPIPDTGLGHAINDRLTRAAAPR